MGHASIRQIDLGPQFQVMQPTKVTSINAWLRAERRAERGGLVAILVFGGLMLSSALMSRWFPHDEGALGQAAERVLLGQIPHRDFDEIYTGLLTYINAATFAALGLSSSVLRIPLLVVSIAWLWSIYRISLRFAKPLGAALVSLAACAWSIRHYPAPMPSWYILFLATACVLALIRWQEDERPLWLVAAGGFGGLAFLFKLSGMFVIFGGALAIVWSHLSAYSRGTAKHPKRHFSQLLGLSVPLLLVCVAVVLVWQMFRAGFSFGYRLGLPASTVCVALALKWWRTMKSGELSHPVSVFKDGAWLALGVAAPIALFALYFAMAGGLVELIEGVLVAPFRRLSYASAAPLPPIALLLAICPVGFFWSPTSNQTRRVAGLIGIAWFLLSVWLMGVKAYYLAIPLTAFLLAPLGLFGRWARVALAATWFLLVAVLSVSDPFFASIGWLGMWGTLFGITVAATVAIISADASTRHSETIRKAVVIACVAIALSLIEYPFASPIYVVYSLPLVIVGVAALLSEDRGTRQIQVTVAVFTIFFGLWRFNPVGESWTRDLTTLELDRSGLNVPRYQAIEYSQLVDLIHQKVGQGKVWAGPDSPEVYFLAGVQNQTRTLFDFLDAPTQHPSRSFPQLLDSMRVSLVVVNLHPGFSKPLAPDVVGSLQEAYPQGVRLRNFLVLWK